MKNIHFELGLRIVEHLPKHDVGYVLGARSSHHYKLPPHGSVIRGRVEPGAPYPSEIYLLTEDVRMVKTAMTPTNQL